jgi:PAS domain S-box-containing protein
MAGMMLGASGGISVAVLASIFWLSVQFGLGEGILPEPLSTAPGFVFIAQAFTVVGFLFTAYMSYLSTQDLQQALDDTTYELVNLNRRLEEARKVTQNARDRVEAILNNSPDAIILLRGPDGGISDGNASFYSMFNLPEGLVVNDTIINFVEDDYVKQLKVALQTVISKQITLTLEVVAKTSDGTTFDAGLALAPITGGELVRGIVCSIRDISERVQAEEQILRSLKEKEILLQEIHHRVKNNLQIISGLLNLQIDEKGNPHTNRILSENRGRILSMAKVHDQLYKSDDFTNVNLMRYTEDLIDQIFSLSDTSKESIKINLDIAEISFDVNRTIYYGLMVNELVVNALKHAFPNGQTGEISISLEQNGGNAYILTIRDNGVGLPNDIDPAESSTLGLSLVHMLTDQLDGSIHIDNDHGTTIVIKFGNE